MEQFINTLSDDIIWSKPLIYLCLGAGLIFSISTRFAQVRHFFEMCRLLFSGRSNDKGISSFQALAVSLSGRVGTGNIAGVAAAIGFGGPGAVFWMWVVAFLGASTAYIEATLGQLYKDTDPVTGQYRGGPAFYFERCIGGAAWKFYGILFALAAIIACGVFLPGVQANSIIEATNNITGSGNMVSTGIFGKIGTNTLAALAAILILLGFIIFGGIKRIANFTQIVVPFMALAYILLALITIFIHIDQVPGVISLIIRDAFSPMAAFGAVIGWGVKRGVYSNEAGQGSGPHAAAAAEVEHPAQQGLVQAFSVYIDTLFVCSATAFMILLTGMYNIQPDRDGPFIIQHLASSTVIDSPAFAQAALTATFGASGSILVAVALFFFAFTTILAYYYIAETNLTYLNEKIGFQASSLFILRLIVMAAVSYGAINSSGYIWKIGDIGVGLMAWLNIVGIIAIFCFARPTMKCLSDYERQKKAGVTQYTFDPKSLGIRHATFWEERFAKQQKNL